MAEGYKGITLNPFVSFLLKRYFIEILTTPPPMNEDNFSEKNLRASLKSSVERQLSRDVVVILDSLNYIKGYRYELYCIARALRTPHCIVRPPPVHKKEIGGVMDRSRSVQGMFITQRNREWTENLLK